MQEDLLKKFLDETTNLSRKVDKTIDTWENSNGKTNVSKKTAASLERLREILKDRLTDVNDTWKEMEDSNDGNKNLQSTQARAVRQAAKQTQFALEQIDAFQREWQEEANCEKRPITSGKTGKTKKNSPQTSTRPSLEHFDRQIKARFGLFMDQIGQLREIKTTTSVIRQQQKRTVVQEEEACHPRPLSSQGARQASNHSHVMSDLI